VVSDEEAAQVDRSRRASGSNGERDFGLGHSGSASSETPYASEQDEEVTGAPVAASKAIRNGLREAYGLFLAAFRDAADLLKAGDRSARFPIGSFPPGLPFVRALPP
jgi:hypothetical protein